MPRAPSTSLRLVPLPVPGRIYVPKMFFPTSPVAYNWFPLNVTDGVGDDQATLYALDAGYRDGVSAGAEGDGDGAGGGGCGWAVCRVGL